MNVNARVLKRFAELEEKILAISDSKRTMYRSTSQITGERSGGFTVVDKSLVHGWAVGVLNLLSGVFGMESIHVELFRERYSQFDGSELSFNECKEVFLAAKEDYLGGYLFNMRGLIQAELFDDVLEQASELLDNGYKDPACVIAGVTLESTLRELCTRKDIPHAKLDKMNADLHKAGVYNLGMQKQITAWADRRNNAAHGEWDEYTAKDVEDMIRGINRFIAENI